MHQAHAPVVCHSLYHTNTTRTHPTTDNAAASLYFCTTVASIDDHRMLLVEPPTHSPSSNHRVHPRDATDLNNPSSLSAPLLPVLLIVGVRPGWYDADRVRTVTSNRTSTVYLDVESTALQLLRTLQSELQARSEAGSQRTTPSQSRAQWSEECRSTHQDQVKHPAGGRTTVTIIIRVSIEVNDSPQSIALP